jgi:hypothetical protein
MRGDYIMSKLDEIKAKGYDIIPDDVNRKYVANWYHMLIVTPDGRNLNFTGLLDAPASIGGITTTRREITNELFHPSEDDWFIYEHGYSKRTGQYFDSVAHSIGLLDYKEHEVGCDKDLVSLEKTEPFDSYLNAELVYGQYEDKHVIQYITRPDIDVYLCAQIVFSHKPTRDAVKTAIDLEKGKTGFQLGKYKEEFTCWECGQSTHWLDVDGDFETKLNRLQEKYCGC